MSAGVIVLRLASALALVALNGYFVSVEFAVVAVRRTRIDQLVAEGNAKAQVARKLLGNPDRVIAASQLGITIASLALGWVGEATVAALILPPMELLVGRWSVVAAHTLATALAFSLVTLLHIVLGEQVPKTMAIRYSERAALAVARPMDAFIRVFRPIIAILDGATGLVVRLMRLEPISGHRSVYTLDELRLVVRESQEGGAIEEQQEEMLQRVFEFGDRQVGEVMIPRTDVVGLEVGSTIQDLLHVFSEVGHSRFPLYGEDLDDIVGIVGIKDVLHALAEEPDQVHAPLAPLARLPLFAPETLPVADLLTRMRATHDQMAIVLDEYGGTAGMVTLEALLEEIVGQLRDEQVVEEEPIVRLDEKTVEIDAQLRVDEVNEALSVELPEGDDYETVAGLMLYRLQKVPHEGDQLQLENVVLEVTRMRGPKIEKLKIRLQG